MHDPSNGLLRTLLLRASVNSRSPSAPSFLGWHHREQLRLSSCTISGKRRKNSWKKSKNA
jgi:hypothetical protein